MKRFLRLLSLAGIVICILCGCEKKQNNTQTDYPDYHPCGGTVKLGTYLGIPYHKAKPSVSDEEVEKAVQNMLLLRPNYVPDESKKDDTVKEGDLINIDFVGTVDGVAFDGGSAKDYLIEVGSGNLIDGFESGIIGAKVGETRNVSVTFPDPYSYDTTLSGAKAVFAITVNYFVMTSTAVTDEYVQRNSDIYKTKEDFYASVRESLMKSASDKADTAVEVSVMNQVLAGCEFVSVAEEDIRYYYQKLRNPYNAYAEQYGVDLETYLKSYTGYQSVAELEQACRADAENSVKQFMVLQEIADKEQITVSQEEYLEYLTEVQKLSGYDSTDVVEALYGENYLKYNKRMEKTIAFIVAHAVEEP